MSEEALNQLSDRVVLKAHNRALPGFEVEKQAKWKSPFFFVQAADTQLGLIDNYGDGTSPDKVTKAHLLTFEKVFIIDCLNTCWSYYLSSDTIQKKLIRIRKILRKEFFVSVSECHLGQGDRTLRAVSQSFECHGTETRLGKSIFMLVCIHDIELHSWWVTLWPKL